MEYNRNFRLWVKLGSKNDKILSKLLSKSMICNRLYCRKLFVINKLFQNENAVLIINSFTGK